jgi:hypothetical protein
VQFKVPQFLDIEDKIFGPFTFRQFVYLVGGGGMCFVLYKLLGFFWGSIPILAVTAFSLALIYYRPNNKPFIYMLEASFKFLMQSKLYIWKRRKVKVPRKNQAEDTQKLAALNYEAKLTGSKLRDLAWSLDVLDLNKHHEL